MNNDAREIFVRNLKKLMKLRKKTQTDISRDLKIPLTTISGWYNGVTYPRVKNMQDLADYFNVSMRDLTDEQNNTMPENSSPVPLYSLICCGNGGFVDDNILDYISLPSSWLSASKEYFAQTASGDSMEGAGIYDGDILVFEKVSTPQQGRIGCFCIDDNEAMCKKYRVAADGRIYLMPANPNYDPIPVDPGMEHFRCLGLLAFVISDRRK